MSYLGSKAGSGTYQAIISQFPPHDVFIDAFTGSGVITLLKPPALKTYAIDFDSTCIDKFGYEIPRSIIDKTDYRVPIPGAIVENDYAGLHLINGDCRSFIAGFEYAAAGRVLIYCDPPYLHSTRGKDRYKYEFSYADHVEFLELLRSIPASIAISGYASSLYADLLDDWRCIEFQSMTRGGVRTEKLWMNYPAESVHWHSYAGENFTDRQRIKRKAQRWAANFRDLPQAERLAVLSAIMSEL
jgi:DNA adenine methylase